MAVTPDMILSVRREVGDTDTVFPILTDVDYEYFLTKNNESVRNASMDAARAILLQLAIRSTDRTVDVLSIKNSKAAEAYRQALILYLRSPDLNGLYKTVNPYGSGISKSDMLSNDSTLDNNYVKPFIPSTDTTSTDPWRI